MVITLASALCALGFTTEFNPSHTKSTQKKTVLTCTDFLSFSLTVHTTPALSIPYLTCKHPTDNSMPLYKASEDPGIWVSIGLSISTNIKGQIESPEYSTVSGMKLVPNYRGWIKEGLTQQTGLLASYANDLGPRLNVSSVFTVSH